jgi:hypothetical protein
MTKVSLLLLYVMRRDAVSRLCLIPAGVVIIALGMAILNELKVGMLTRQYSQLRTMAKISNTQQRVGKDFGINFDNIYRKGERVTQTNLIYDHLKQGNKLTALNALKLFGCSRLASRINELRNEGFDIQDTFVSVKRGGKVKSYKQYWMEG